ncbi:hypothetical protein GEMRC1_013367 [Eukaryota sp. GEM-RC1]
MDKPFAILGIDEAGRGPVLGPMVYAIAACIIDNPQDDYIPLLEHIHDLNDSKELNSDKRTEIFASLKSLDYFHFGNITKDPISLNDIAKSSVRELLRSFSSKFNIVKCYVDTLGKASFYSRYLSSVFPDIPFKVSAKADSLFPIVSAASICAKVTRDDLLFNFSPAEDIVLDRSFGSGYPADPVVKAWLKRNFDDVFGWCSFVRFDWSTAVTLMEKKGVKVKWEDDKDAGKKRTKGKRDQKSTKNQMQITQFFSQKNQSILKPKSVIRHFHVTF